MYDWKKTYKSVYNYSKVDITGSGELFDILKMFQGDLKVIILPSLVSLNIIRKTLHAKSSTIAIIGIYDDLDRIDILLDRLKVALETFQDSINAEKLHEVTKKNIRSFFKSGNLTDEQINFFKLIITYQELYYHNHHVRKDWSELGKIFEKVTVNLNNTTILKLIIVDNIYPRIDMVEAVEILLRRMKYYLFIKQEKIIYNHAVAEGQYFIDLTYSLSSILDENLNEKLLNLHQEVDAKVVDVKEGSLSIEPTIKQRVSCIKNNAMLDTRGNKLFNQNFFYLLKIKNEKLEIEEAKLKQSLYMETDIHPHDISIRRNITRQFIARKVHQDNCKLYYTFLDKYFHFIKSDVIIGGIKEFFTGINDYIFIYHFGPFYFFKVVLDTMRKDQTGFIHRYTSETQIIREILIETVKLKLGQWWDDNVYIDTQDEQRNSAEAYEQLVSYSHLLWQNKQQSVLLGIHQNSKLTTSYSKRDIKPLTNFIQDQLDYMHYMSLVRFLGVDFVFSRS